MFDIQLLLMLVYLHNAASMSYLSNISYVHALSSLGGSIKGLPEVGNGEDSISIFESQAERVFVFKVGLLSLSISGFVQRLQSGMTYLHQLRTLLS